MWKLKNINISLRVFGNGQYKNIKSHRVLTKEEQKNLNAAQQTALLDMPNLSSSIFSKEQQSWFKNRAHAFALRELIQSQKLSPEESMQRLSGLTHWQAMGLVNGLLKEEVIGLNESQVQALEKLRQHGLTHTDLRGKNWFDSWEQQYALNIYMTSSGMSAKEALEELEKDFRLIAASNLSESISKDYVKTIVRQSFRLSSLWKEPRIDKIGEDPKKEKIIAPINSNVTESSSKKFIQG
jgi:hypothetical protein